MKSRKLIKVAIDSPSAAGAGSLAKLISAHFNLVYLDTGKIYRFIGKIYLENPKKFNYALVQKVSKNLNLKKLQDKKLLTDEIAVAASIIAKDKKIRQIVHGFQKKIAYFPPKKYAGSCLDGRDITSKIVKDAEFKFYVTANVLERCKRRTTELKKLGKKIKFKDILKSIKKRDKSDMQRAISPLIRTKDSWLINTTHLSIRGGFLKIKKIMDKKLKENYARNI